MLSALTFLTILGRGQAPRRSTVRWFPLVGAGIGLAVGGTWWAGAEFLGPGLGAALAVAVDLALTGLLHFDGLADSADGLLAPMSRERRLEVMGDPNVGAFALAVVPVVLLIRWMALVEAEPDPVAVAAIWSASRTLMAVVPSAVPYARAEGLAPALSQGSSAAIALALPVAGGLAGLSAGPAGAAAIGVTVLAGAAVVALARRRLGGYTGDVLGAAGVVGETAALVALAAP